MNQIIRSFMMSPIYVFTTLLIFKGLWHFVLPNTIKALLCIIIFPLTFASVLASFGVIVHVFSGNIPDSSHISLIILTVFLIWIVFCTDYNN